MTATNRRGEEAVSTYLADVLESIRHATLRSFSKSGASETLADEVFSVLTSREFCYLGRKKAEKYRSSVVPLIERRMARVEPFRFFYDIGPGYHASTRPGVVPLNYEMGLSELLILSQVCALCSRIAGLYGLGGCEAQV